MYHNIECKEAADDNRFDIGLEKHVEDGVGRFFP